MVAIGGLLLMLGKLVGLISWIWMLIEIFKSGLLWFIGCLLIPFLGLIWLVLNWQEGKQPFFLGLVGAAITGLGLILSGV